MTRKAEQARQRGQADAERRQRVSAGKDSPARVSLREKAGIIRCGGEQAARHQPPNCLQQHDEANGEGQEPNRIASYNIMPFCIASRHAILYGME